MSEEKKINTVNFKDGTWLADVIPFLPNGIIDKTVTGIGATHLEAICSRNSIIVEPVRAIVISKSQKHGCLGFMGGSTKEDVIEYLENNRGKYKKIFVVSDSVGKLMTILLEQKIDVFNEYFYLIDEIEQYQTEAGYRGKMGVALDYYKEFDPKNRALVTATLYEFSNPVLSAEPITRYRYETPFRRKVNLRITNCPVIETLSVLEKLEGKNLIFFNSIDGILNLIELGNLSKQDCAIFCGDASKEKVGALYSEFTNTPEKKYNFFTSAYFSGIDINGDYNVLTVIDVNKIYTLLYPCKLRQIIGRVRNTVLSDTIISNYTPHLEQEYNTYVESRLNESLKAIGIIEYNRNIPDNKYFMGIREAIIKHEFDGILLIREDKDGNVVPNFEEIDYKYIHIRSGNDLYSSDTGLSRYLKVKGNEVSLTIINSKFSAEQICQLNAYREKIVEERTLATIKVYEIIKCEESKGTVDFSAIDFRQMMYQSTGVTKKLLKFYNDYKDAEALLESNGDEKYFNDYKIKYSFQKLNENHSFKVKLNSVFHPSDRFTSTEIAKNLNRIFTEEVPGSKALSKRKAVSHLKKFFQIERCKIPTDSVARMDAYEIIGPIAA